MICKECGNEQNEGNFCGECGGRLVPQEELGREEVQIEEKDPAREETVVEELVVKEAVKTPPTKEREEVDASTEAQATKESNDEASPQPAVDDQINEYVELAKEKTSTFLVFLQRYLKKPRNILGNYQDEFSNGLIAIILNFFLLSLTLSLVGNNFVTSYMNYSVIANLLKIFIILVLSTVLLSGLSFILNKFFGIKINFKEYTALYGAYMLPILILSGLALLLSIIQSNTVAITLTLVAIGLSLFAIPSYLIILLLTENDSSIDPFYGQLIYLVGATIIYSVLLTVIVDSALGELLNSMNYYFY